MRFGAAELSSVKVGVSCTSFSASCTALTQQGIALWQEESAYQFVEAVQCKHTLLHDLQHPPALGSCRTLML